MFHSAVCNADAVVIGILNDKSSQLTDGKNFVFTDYQITVEEIIKDNAVAPIPTASVITGTRDGGAIELNNRIFWAKREDFDPPIVGRRYLLFLRFIPATGAYLMYGNGSFQLAGQRVLALGPASRDEVTKGGVEDSLAFLNQIRTYAGKRTHSLVMTSESKHIRFVDSIHIEGVRGAGTNLYSHFRTGRVQDWNEGSRFKWNNSRYQQLSETENTRQARTRH